MPKAPIAKRSIRRHRPKQRPHSAPFQSGMSVDLAIVSHDGVRSDAVHISVGQSARTRKPLKTRSKTIAPSTLAAWAKSVSRRARPTELARLLAALSHPQRLQILLYLLAGEASYRSLARQTTSKAGPLYHHIRELRSTNLLTPKQRDLYALTTQGRRVILATLAMQGLTHR